MMGLELLAPWMAVFGLFYLLRRLEIWLHQHIFKVGWLMTRQNRTTTVLYYVFFLPGIVLHQIIIWMVAGFLNVRAERTLAWPEQQEIGELKLDFVRIAPDAGGFRLALIHSAPLLAGLIATSLIGTYALNIRDFQNAMGGGTLNSITHALHDFASAPDFWLWLYLAFTIANTMMPDFARLRGWRAVLLMIGIIVAALYLIGAGDQVVMNNLRQPATDAVNGLAALFAAIIVLDLFAVAVLGSVEAIIERVTGHSATFENGRLVTLARQEMLARRASERKPIALQPKEQPSQQKASGLPSVYAFPFPIPGPPGREVVRREPGGIMAPPEQPELSARALEDPRAGASVITGLVADRPQSMIAPDDVSTQPKPSVKSSTPSHSGRPETGAPVVENNEDVLPSVDDVTYEDYEDPA